MKIEEFNVGQSFRVSGIAFGRLCRYLAGAPEVSFVRRRRFFWSSWDVGAEFRFRGELFKIDTDDELWITTGDGQHHPLEMQALREHIERQDRAPSVMGALLRRICGRPAS